MSQSRGVLRGAVNEMFQLRQLSPCVRSFSLVSQGHRITSTTPFGHTIPIKPEECVCQRIERGLSYNLK